MKRLIQTSARFGVGFAVILSVVQSPTMAFAQQGKQKPTAEAQEGHGGDLACDAKIQGIAANLRGWIKEHGPQMGPLDLSSSLNPDTAKPFTFHEYDSAMLSFLDPFIAKPLVKCAPGPIEVAHADKICKSWTAGDGLHILCDLDRFPRLSSDERVEQIHHEFATNVTGLEPDDGPLSSYKISVQLSGGMANIVERKLVAKPFSSPSGTTGFVSIPLNNYCGDGIPQGAGCFWMGSPTGETGRYDNEKQHEVVLTKRFEMETTPVTQKQWFDVMGNNPSNFCSKEACPTTHQLVQGSNGQLTCLCPNNPVEQVNYDDARQFIQKLNDKQDGHSYALPTEAQWEYSARAGTSTAYYFGDDASSLGDHAWYRSNSGSHTHEVAQKGANAFGLYDMEGNVWEWVSDWYADDYGQASGCNVSEDPAGPSSGSDRVFRGGSWDNDARLLRSAFRSDVGPSARSSDVGFRLVRTSP